MSGVKMEPIKILFVEDLFADVEMARRTLKKGNIEFIDRVVDTEEEFQKALAEFSPNLIISDYSMPTFDGMRALKITRSQSIYLPFIILTGSMNEETAVACMKAGADDYVIKEQIKRLPFAVGEVVHKVNMQREKVHAEKKLRQSEEKYRVLVENAGEVILVAQNGEIKFVNRRVVEFLGYAPEEMTGKSFSDYVFPEDRETINKMDLKRLQGENLSGHNPFRVIDRAGHSKWVEVNAVVIDWEKKPATLNFLKDITAQRSLEDQLRQAHKMESVGRLAGGVAHDYNNMLSVILGYTEMAMEKIELSDPLHDDLKQVLKAANRSAEITRQLLAFARKQTIVPRTLDLNRTVDGMLKMLRRLIGEDIDLAWLPDPGLWPVKMDPSQIDQILANLCVNARDAIADVGKVTIETGKVTFDKAYCSDHPGFITGDFVLLAVSDDGCGMDKEIFDKIFEPFFTTKGVGEGTGLGLSTVYGIVKQNNGFINVYSEIDKGTTFRIYLPRHEGKTSIAKVLDMGTMPQGRGETVLVVEDDPAVMKVTTRMLKKLGYQVLSAGTPGEAKTLAAEHAGSIDLMITDVVMPEMNGRDLANHLHILYPSLKILFMSGYTADVIAHRGMLGEGVNFIQKPFSIKALGDKVVKALFSPLSGID